MLIWTERALHRFSTNSLGLFITMHHIISLQLTIVEI